MRSSFQSTVALALAGVTLVLGAFTGAAARPQIPAEKREFNFYRGVPACDDSSVLGKIQSKFAAREADEWNSGLQIAAFENIYETGVRSSGLDYIPRRFCVARARFADGRPVKVYYAIAAEMGWLGVAGFGLEWCVDGYDRNHAYGANCRAARP
jgi:hypothetical protein